MPVRRLCRGVPVERPKEYPVMTETGLSPLQAAALPPRRCGGFQLEPQDPPLVPLRPAGGRLPGRTRCTVPRNIVVGPPTLRRSRGEPDERTVDAGPGATSQR